MKAYQRRWLLGHRMKVKESETHEVRGYDARAPQDLQEALQLLTEFGNAESLHETVSRPLRWLHNILQHSHKEISYMMKHYDSMITIYTYDENDIDITPLEVSNWLVCMHTSPGNPPNIGAALSELRQSLFRPKAKRLGSVSHLFRCLKRFSRLPNGDGRGENWLKAA